MMTLLRLYRSGYARQASGGNFNKFFPPGKMETSEEKCLFPDTKFTKDIIKPVFISNLAGYFAEVMKATIDVDRK